MCYKCYERYFSDDGYRYFQVIGFYIRLESCDNKEKLQVTHLLTLCTNVSHGILFGRRELPSHLEAGSCCRWSLKSFPSYPVLIRS